RVVLASSGAAWRLAGVGIVNGGQANEHAVREAGDRLARLRGVVRRQAIALRQLLRGLVEGLAEERERLHRLAQRHAAPAQLAAVLLADRADLFLELRATPAARDVVVHDLHEAAPERTQRVALRLRDLAVPLVGSAGVQLTADPRGRGVG